MKKAIARVLTVCAMSCAAETVSFSVPVLTVKSDGRTVIAGSGKMQKCPFTFYETTNATPVRVSIVEDVPSGAGNSMRASVWLAVTTASLTLNRDLAGETISFETSGYVDGSSAGGMLCLAVMSAIEGRPFPDDFAMTGTIMADGTIGAVGGISEKLRAASRNGIKRVCIPTFARMDENFTDLLDLGKELKLEMHQVSTVDEAYRILHRIPIRQTARLNPTVVCRLPTITESVLKSWFVTFAKECPQNDALCNRQMNKSVEEFNAGLFGAGIMDILSGLEDYSSVASKIETPPVELYPALEHSLPTNEASDVGMLFGKAPDKARFIEELRAFHRDLKEAAASSADDELEVDDSADTGDMPKVEQAEDWFNDSVDSPSGAQFVTLANIHYLKKDLLDLVCQNITREIDSVEDWNALDAGQLNYVRDRLTAKMNTLTYIRRLDEGGETYGRVNALYVGLMESTPYVRPNASVRQIENTFYSTMRSMDSVLHEEGITSDNDNLLVQLYACVREKAESCHAKRDGSDVDMLRAVFSEVQTLSLACSLSVLREAAVNSAFFNSVVSTARENALVNIAECKKLGIPCVMPVVRFQEAESKRDAFAPGDDVELNRLDVFSGYLEASISAKALVLCFTGRKPEVNAKGYCSKSLVCDSFDSGLTCFTIRYYGVDGNPILRDGFSGWRTSQMDGVEYTSWLDLEGRDVRYKTTNECWTSAYDASGRLIRKTYCNELWVPTPNAAGILFETKGYDANGNEILWEFFDLASNHVACADGMATIRRRFNSRGQETWRRFYGVKGEPTSHKDGNAGFDVVYDKKGNQRKFIFVDCHGKPVITKQGYASEERKYDAKGNLVETSWFDGDGKMVCVNGVARTISTYDERGNKTAEEFYDSHNRLTRNAFNYAVLKMTYDAAGQMIECCCYGPDGKPTQDTNGVASWKAILDASGQAVGRRYYDLNGNELDQGDDSATR